MKRQDRATYSPEELEAMISRMVSASDIFYRLAQSTGVHAFIEFTGLQNKFIDMCRNALRQGIDFTQTNIHTGGALPMVGHDAAYLGEKFGCIFGSSLMADDDVLMVFLQEVLGDAGMEKLRKKLSSPIVMDARPSGMDVLLARHGRGHCEIDNRTDKLVFVRFGSKPGDQVVSVQDGNGNSVPFSVDPDGAIVIE